MPQGRDDAATLFLITHSKPGYSVGPGRSPECNKSAPYVALGPMSTTALSTRHSRGINSKRRNLQQLPRKSGFKLREYLEMAEVNALIAAAPNPKARLIRLEQWRAGLSEGATADS